MRQPDARVEMKPIPIWPPVGHGRTHAREQGWIHLAVVAVVNSENSTHKFSLVGGHKHSYQASGSTLRCRTGALPKELRPIGKGDICPVGTASWAGLFFNAW